MNRVSRRSKRWRCTYVAASLSTLSICRKRRRIVIIIIIIVKEEGEMAGRDDYYPYATMFYHYARRIFCRGN